MALTTAESLLGAASFPQVSASSLTTPGFDQSSSLWGVNYITPSADAPPSANAFAIPNTSPLQDFLSTTFPSLTNLFGINSSQTVNDAINKGLGLTPASSSSSSNFFTDLFLRAVVIILGFIFVGIGLSMFNGNKNVVQVVTGGVKKVAKAVT